MRSVVRSLKWIVVAGLFVGALAAGWIVNSSARTTLKLSADKQSKPAVRQVHKPLRARHGAGEKTATSASALGSTEQAE